METKAGQKMVIEAKIIRANGNVEDLGKIIGGNWIEKVVSFIKIKLANLKNRWRQ
jgi:hypothetical protein